MPHTSQRRKTELSKIIKRGNASSTIPFLLRALLDNDLSAEEHARYERTLKFLTSRRAPIETETVAKEEPDPFA
jgi:hypothetical protein